MRIIFMGSAELACPCLDRLLAHSADKVVGVVTQPDRPKGRSLQVAPCAVHAHVATLGIPVLTPENVNTPDSVAALCALAPDLIIVVAYGQFLKADILNLPLCGPVNVHASLLPKYRGAAPIQWAVANGETETGVTTMFVNARMDAGDIIDRIVEPIRPEDTAGSLHDRLAQCGAELLARTLEALRQGSIRRRPQNEAEATLAPRIKKADGRMDWRLPATLIHNRVRGFNPWPGCFCELLPVGVVRVLKSRVEPGRSEAVGTVLEAAGEGPLIQTGQDALRLLEVQPEGRKVMSGAAFLRGHPLTIASRCNTPSD
ncbi:MAG: methionyl-tRNA formyltransferase [Verrucomicrobia bacterium]|nr:methionyl-tRNA formyltransferase [Verrucomicrobiota bacterium]MBU1734497.1 methionyl-tRNA formyltransferase [Verrucomicrobiota bacterium]MBU1856467.1 methionyl-tRNA formyltransferase [Verrucomicrobiota bacterium]